MAKLSAVAKNKDHMTHRIMSDRQLPSVQFPTDCLALKFSVTPQETMPQQEKKQSKAKKIKERGGKNKKETSQ